MAFKGLSTEAVGGAAMKQRRINANLFGPSYAFIGKGGGKWITKLGKTVARMGGPPAPRGSIHSAWTGSRYRSKPGMGFKNAGNISGLKKSKQGGGSSSRSEAARKAWRTRRGH